MFSDSCSPAAWTHPIELRRGPGLLLFVACCGPLIPLLALAGYLGLRGGEAMAALPLLAVTGIGAMLSLLAAAAVQQTMFVPLLRTCRTLDHHLRSGADPRSPLASTGEGGVRMRDAEAAAHRFVRLIGFQEDLLAVLSHDARSPLSSIRFATEMSQSCLREAVPDLEELREMNLIVREATQRQVTLLEHLFTIVRAEAGEIRPRPAPVVLQELLAGVATRAAVQAQAGSVELLVEPAGTRGVTVTVDAELTKQVLDHLVHNAIRFTPAGGTVEVAGRVQRNSLELYVRDTGSGISLDQLASLWRRSRVEQPADSSPRGSDVGLWKCRVLTELQGGRIEVESESGVGSSFRVVLPITDVVRPRSRAVFPVAASTVSGAGPPQPVD